MAHQTSTPPLPLLLLLAATHLSCAPTETFPGPVDPPPNAKASASQSPPSAEDSGAPPLGLLLSDAGPNVDAAAGDPYAPHENRTCEDRHSPLSCHVSDPRSKGDLVRSCARHLPEGSPKTTGTMSVFLNPDGTLLTVRTQVSPYTSAFVSCIELGARKWIRMHLKKVTNGERVRFAVDAKSPER